MVLTSLVIFLSNEFHKQIRGGSIHGGTTILSQIQVTRVQYVPFRKK
jgi:hypothetical protein